MKHLIECINNLYVKMIIEQIDEDEIQISIVDDNTKNIEFIIMDSKSLFEVIGSLHHFQKQLKK